MVMVFTAMHLSCTCETCPSTGVGWRLLPIAELQPIDLRLQAVAKPDRLIGCAECVLPEARAAACPHRNRLERLRVTLEHPPVLPARRSGPEALARSPSRVRRRRPRGATARRPAPDARR